MFCQDKKTGYFCNSFFGRKFFSTIKYDFLGVYQSGQMGQTVNLLAFAYGGSNPSAPTGFFRVMRV